MSSLSVSGETTLSNDVTISSGKSLSVGGGLTVTGGVNMQNLHVPVITGVTTINGQVYPPPGGGDVTGVEWTSRTSAADNNWYSVTYGNGLFVAVSDSGSGNRVMTSPDGITWTSRTSTADNSWYSVTYGNGLFVAVSWTGSGNRVMTSGKPLETIRSNDSSFKGTLQVPTIPPPACSSANHVGMIQIESVAAGTSRICACVADTASTFSIKCSDLT